MLLVCPLFWNQGDMGPLGEMGLPGPNGLKVISETHGMETVAFNVLYCLVWTALELNYVIIIIMLCYVR